MEFKKVQALVRTSKFEDIRKSLHQIGVEYFNFYEVKNVSFQNEQKGSYRGVSLADSATLIPKRMLELIIPSVDVESVVECIKKSAKTNEAGDGKIYVSDIESVIRIS